MHFRSSEPTTGAGRDKTPLVCLHESPQSGSQFLHFQPALGADRLVLCPDIPGYGASDGPFNQPEIDDYAGAFADALTSLGYGAGGGGPVDILGFHTGNAIAAALTGQRSDLVRSLVMPGTPYFPPPVREQHRRQYGQPRPFHDPDYVGSTYRTLVLKIDVPADSPEAQRDSVLPLHRRYEMFVTRLRPGTRSHFGFEAVFRYDLERALTAISQPVLLPVLNEWLNEPTRQAASLIPDSRLVECPQFTKYVWDLEPTKIADIIRPFLDRSPHSPASGTNGSINANSGHTTDGPTQHWRGYVDTRHGQMHVRSARPARVPEVTRTPVVLLHPCPASSNAFKELLQDLGSDRTVHAPDMPGFGESDWPGTNPAIVDLAQTTAEVLAGFGHDAQHGNPVDLFGVGMGAFVAAELAHISPGLVRRVVLCSVPYRAHYLKSYDFYSDPDYVDRLYKRVVEAGDARLTFQRRLDHFTDLMVTGRNAEWGDLAAAGYDADRGLGALDRPTLFMAFDDASGDATVAAKSRVARSKYVQLQGVEALGYMSQPERIAHAIRGFLDTRDTG